MRGPRRGAVLARRGHQSPTRIAARPRARRPAPPSPCCASQSTAIRLHTCAHAAVSHRRLCIFMRWAESAAETRCAPLYSVTRQELMDTMASGCCSNWAPTSSAVVPHSVTTTVFALHHTAVLHQETTKCALRCKEWRPQAEDCLRDGSPPRTLHAAKCAMLGGVLLGANRVKKNPRVPHACK